jgi:hypothetical protein
VTDYATLLQQKNSPANMASDANRVGQLLDKYGSWIDKYRGGMPKTWMGTIMLWESDGNAGLVGDASLGEFGLYQVASYVPPLFGLPSSARLDPESNVAIASLEYATEAIRWFLRYPNLVVLGTPDSWKLARLTFAVGRAGGYQLADMARPTNQGHVFDDIKAYVAASGGVQLGGQSPDKVWFRVMSLDTQWKIAEIAAGGSLSPGNPELIPNPLPTGSYSIPVDLLPYFSKPVPLLLIAAAGALGALVYIRTRRR